MKTNLSWRILGLLLVGLCGHAAPGAEPSKPCGPMTASLDGSGADVKPALSEP